MPQLEKDQAITTDEDQRVFLRGLSWEQYEALLEMRGESSGVRMTFLEGEVELMSPSRRHETYKKLIARLVEAYAEESGLDLNGYGSWTIKDRAVKRGGEPDECYVLGSHETERPDIAIEVMWSRGGLDRFEVWRGLRVPELWVWKRGGLTLHSLGEDGRYYPVPRSRFLPDLDVAHLASFLDRTSQTEAVRAYRATLRSGPRST